MTYHSDGPIEEKAGVTFECNVPRRWRADPKCRGRVSYDGDYPICPICGLVYSQVEPAIGRVEPPTYPPWAEKSRQNRDILQRLAPKPDYRSILKRYIEAVINEDSVVALNVMERSSQGDRAVLVALGRESCHEAAAEWTISFVESLKK